MKLGPVEYSAPTEVEEALALLEEHGEDGKVLAGGQSLIPLLALRLSAFDHLIDVNRVRGLGGVRLDGGELVIGAATRQRAIERDAAIAEHAPLLAEATRYIGHFQIRSRGTLGGSLAHADPAAEYPAVALVLGASVEVAGSGGARRTIGAEDLFDFAYETSLEPGELLLSVRIPVRRARSGFAIEEVARRHGDFALVGCAASVRLGAGGRIEEARLAMFGTAPRASRLERAESLLSGADPADLDLGAAMREATAEIDPPADVQASAEYRRAIAPIVAERALARALAGAEAGA